MDYLSTLFVDFNRKYFGNKIPKMRLGYAKSHIIQWAFFDDSVEPYIMLSPVLKDYQLALEGVLIHEMIHAFLWDKYCDYQTEEESPHLWMNHTKEFRNIERMYNIRHFGKPKAHETYYNLMTKDLTSRGLRLGDVEFPQEV